MGTVSAAFQDHLHQLCLRQFPCGTGSWNKSRFMSKKRKPWRAGSSKEEENLDPGEESLEALVELAHSPHSPWVLPEDSSAEDHYLRELAIRNPHVLRDTFFFSYFKCLRVVDKGVKEIDSNLLKFSNLEELILTANRIRKVNAENLPQTLKVLELYGNEITDTEGLCSHPPPNLQHLGLGSNRLFGSLEAIYFSANFWPNLVSLDLGFNDLTELQNVVSGLCPLRKLRLLVLQGNPLALVPSYRGFTIDSLSHLCVLDDITVSPDERHQFWGLSHKRALVEDEVQLVVTLGRVGGVPDSAAEDPEPGPDGPFISYSYYVTYDFMEDEEAGGGSKITGVLAEVIQPSGSQGSLISKGPPEDDKEARELEAPLPITDARLTPPPGVVLFSTLHKPWADVIECNYSMQHCLTDLVPLKTFLLSGTTVTVVEEKILSWPILPPPPETSPPGKKGKKNQEKSKKNQEMGKKKQDMDKKSQEMGKKKEKPKGGKEVGKHKRKENPQDLQQDPPLLRVLGSGHLSLEPLVSGEAQVSAVCNFGVLRSMPIPGTASIKETKKDKKSGKKDESGQKAAARGKGKIREYLETEMDDPQPEPLTVEIHVQLIQWKSTAEAMKK
ncbi:leucine-rich repeat-containing protein 43 isoform X1 [Ornithorhynchus anatinus]|uniref:leucine-rich repeat-containing protein 43 isoform X1 n=2 Tax=Ornithorhynchus anatinus TaxID=9258 RepID=UPI0010A8FF78|nr:leucine-rich repeat-containing protein 43 isoform X1 [Ornithorhynchus anatinus]